MIVSVIMPVHNGGEFLDEALESILKQTYTDFELVIVDDGSTDSTNKILQSYSKKDSRIKISKNLVQSGVGFTLNRAINLASGQYLARADADDVMAPTRLEKELSFLIEHPEIVAVGSWTKVINSKGKVTGERRMPITHKKIKDMMFYAMGMQNPTVMFNRKLIPTDFSWCRKSIVIDDDLDLLFRLMPFGKFANIPIFLVNYRIHENNLSLKNPKTTFIEAQGIRKKAVLEYGYKPTVKARLINFTERIIMKLIPEQAILPIYNIFRRVTS